MMLQFNYKIAILLSVLFSIHLKAAGQLKVEYNPSLEINKPLLLTPNEINIPSSFDDLLAWQQVRYDTIPFYGKLVSAGDILYKAGQSEAARNWYQSALPYFALFKPNMLSRLYGKIANTYKSYNNSLAIQWNIKALEAIGNEKNSEITKAKLYTNIASIFVDIQDYPKVFFYLDKAIPIFEYKKDTVDAAIAFANKGRIYQFLKDHDKAIENYIYSLNLIEEMMEQGNSDSKTILLRSQVITNITAFYVNENNPDSALLYLNKIKNNIAFLPLDEQTNIQSLYGSILAAKKEYKAAEQYLQQSLAIAEQHKFKEIINSTDRLLANLYIDQKDYENALRYGLRYINMQYDLFQRTKKSINDINNLESKYQIARKDNELMQKQLLIAQQEKNIAKKNLLLLSILLGASALLLIFGILYRSYHRKQRLILQQKEIEQLKAMMKGEENERSRLARELHDGIGGMLAAIKLNLGSVKKEYPGLEGIQQLDKITYMLQDTSAEVRKTAHNLMPDVLTRYSLEDALLLYFNKINEGKTLKVDLQCHGDLAQLRKSEELILYRIIQELTQNIVKHAQATHAEVQLMQYENKLVLTVEDNGKGFDEPQQSSGGFGLQNLRYRVQALQGTVAITSVKGKNTTVHIEFDLEKLKFMV